MGPAGSCSRTPRPSICSAIRVIAAGDALLGPSVTRRLIREFASRPTGQIGSRAAFAALDAITEREREVLLLVAEGLTNGEIAQRLFIEAGTAKTHVAHLLSKLDARDRVQLVILAYQSGLVAASVPTD